jgi:RNA-binding protein
MTATTQPALTRLTGTQRKYLRGLAHSLVPVVHVGKAGVNDAVIAATSRALDDHELIKVKIAALRDERERIAVEIERECDAQLAGTIGTIAILYRPKTDPLKRGIVLPARATPPQDGSA